MKKIIRLTETDLARIVKRVISEEEYNFDETSAKLLGKYFTEKQGFEYIGNNGDKEMYALKKRGFSIVVTLMSDDDPSKVRIMIHISLPMGKKINYLEEVDGRSSMVVKTNDYQTLFRYLQGALDFGRSQFDVDTLPPLPKF